MHRISGGGVAVRPAPPSTFLGYDKWVNNFKDRVLGIVAKIPKGETLSYKQVAALAGSPRAYRAVGNIMNKNENPKVPCHRVIKSDGAVGGYAHGAEKKKAILQKEGAI